MLAYIKRTGDIVGRPRSLFVSVKNNCRSMSKNAVSFFIRNLIASTMSSGVKEGPAPRAHSVRSVSTSVAFQKNCSLSKIFQTAIWKTNSVFSSFYLKDVATCLGEMRSLGSIVVAGQVVNPSE